MSKVELRMMLQEKARKLKLGGSENVSFSFVKFLR